MANVNVTEQHNRVIVQEDGTVRVVSAGVPGPPGPAGPPGDLDTEELEQMVSDGVDAHDVATDVHGVGASTVASADDVNAAQSVAQDHADSAVSDHNAAINVHGIPDTTQLATQDDLANLEPLPEPGDDGDVLMLADGSPTWAAPEGGGGLDPDGEETITGDWLFDRENLRVGANDRLAIGIGTNVTTNSVAIGPQANAGSSGAVAIGEGAGASGGYQHTVWIGQHAGSGSGVKTLTVFIGGFAGVDSNGSAATGVGRESLRNNSANFPTAVGQASGFGNSGAGIIALGRHTGRDNSGDSCILIGLGAGRNNTRANRLIIDTAASSSGNLVDPLIDGRFRAGTDPDSFEYSKGLKINGHLETTDQLILRSPDGTRWAITVDDSGNLSTAPATEEITP